MRGLVTALRVLIGLLGISALIIVATIGYLYYDYSRDEPQTFYDQPRKQFRYGSTGGDRLVGIPVGIFDALPVLCRDYLPGDGWQSLGFIIDPKDRMSRPVGTSLRRSLGFERISLNCATCHTGTYRMSEGDVPTVVEGMPANRLDLGLFTQFLTQCALDERFNPWQVIQAAEDAGARYSWLDRLLLQYVGVPAMKEFLVLAQHRFRFLKYEPAPGAGRFDTFGPEKALLNWNVDKLPQRERVGIVDFPSLWLQGPREAAAMRLHWDGNNSSVEERNRSAAFGTGAAPAVRDVESLAFIADWLRQPANAPPRYPRLAERDPAMVSRGEALYGEYCAACHGKSGRDFTGSKVGMVEPIESIGTDPCRLDNYTYALAVEQGNLYAAFPDARFRHFRKTNGYANLPLDGLWLRGPYLHNGSVPTVRDLLEPSERRPAVFYRGDDLVDHRRLGFRSDRPESNGVKLFRFETRCIGDATACGGRVDPENRHENYVCLAGEWAGNSNRGHEGRAYGTELPDADKDAIVEFLKGF